MYSDKVKDHFMNPRNMGEMENPDGIGEVGNPVCGDMMRIFIRVEDMRITEVMFQTFGCAAAIATSSMITELAKNRTLDDAMEITRDDVANELDGLPKIKMHCSNLAADGLHAAIEDYYKRLRGDVPEDSPVGTATNPCDSCAQLHEGECDSPGAHGL
jgi:nitrogen fixation NifU-like protein